MMNSGKGKQFDRDVDLKDVPISDSSAVCSVCLELVELDGKRGRAKLQCGHEFHLDCIGSAFNVKGTMECPTCRDVENGQWMYSVAAAEQPTNVDMINWIAQRHPFFVVPQGFHLCSLHGLVDEDNVPVEGRIIYGHQDENFYNPPPSPVLPEDQPLSPNNDVHDEQVFLENQDEHVDIPPSPPRTSNDLEFSPISDDDDDDNDDRNDEQVFLGNQDEHVDIPPIQPGASHDLEFSPVSDDDYDVEIHDSDDDYDVEIGDSDDDDDDESMYSRDDEDGIPMENDNQVSSLETNNNMSGIPMTGSGNRISSFDLNDDINDIHMKENDTQRSSFESNANMNGLSMASNSPQQASFNSHDTRLGMNMGSNNNRPPTLTYGAFTINSGHTFSTPTLRGNNFNPEATNQNHNSTIYGGIQAPLPSIPAEMQGFVAPYGHSSNSFTSLLANGIYPEETEPPYPDYIFRWRSEPSQ